MHTMPALAAAGAALPALRARGGGAGDLAALCALDREINAWKLAAETREASVQLGVRRLKALVNISPRLAAAGEFARDIDAGRGARAITSSSAACRPPWKAFRCDAALNASLTRRSPPSARAALKLIRIGQEGMQRALRAACAANCRGCVATSCSVAREEAGWFNPLLEIASMRHERADERLFISCNS